MRDNYMSAKDNSAVVQAQFEKEAELAAMVELTVAEAESQWGPISVAPLHALEKKDGSLRVIHDATHGLPIKSKISPMGGDLKRAVQVLRGACFLLTGDVARAHRLVKVATCDWRHQCCRTFAKGPDVVWANCVGSFGVASAAYHWHRLMAGLGRSPGARCTHAISLRWWLGMAGWRKRGAREVDGSCALLCSIGVAFCLA